MDPLREQGYPVIEMKPRYEGLDQLRGILAFSVMIYHYSDWHRISLPWPLQKPLELLGLYAVSTFYTLSGCALFLVYRNRIIDRAFLAEFWIKRTFRIVPLFWLVSVLVLLLDYQGNPDLIGQLDRWKLFLNFSLLFSWLDPTAYYATGAWSIGNEWAFYTLFPLILIASRGKWSGVCLALGALGITALFSFGYLSHGKSVATQWATYINPLNQVILFVGGVLIGPVVVNSRPRRHLPLFVLVAAAIFIAISYVASVPECITGLPRIVLVGICIVCCAGFGMTRMPHGWISKTLTYLGAISYTVYLMHPLMHHVVSKILGKIASSVGGDIWSSGLLDTSVICCSVISSLLVSALIYRLIEKPAVGMGRSFAERYRVRNPQTAGHSIV